MTAFWSPFALAAPPAQGQSIEAMQDIRGTQRKIAVDR